MPRHTNVTAWLLTVAVAALWLFPPVAAAETSPGGGSNAETERNRLSFHPSIQLSSVADSNVELAKTDTDGDLGIFIAPRAEVAYQGTWFNLGADLGVDLRRYANGDSPSDEFYRMIGKAEFGLMPGLTLTLSDAYVPTPVELGRPLDHAENLIQTNRSVAELSFWRALPFEREMRITFQGTRLFGESFGTRLASGIFDPDFHADFWEGSVVGEFQAPLAGRTSGFARSQLRYRSFDDASASDFGDIAVLVGIRSHWYRHIDFDIAAGYGLVEFDGGRSTHRFLGQANLRYRMPGGTVLRVAAVNRNTADIAGNDFIETRGGIGLERRFGERTSASAEVFLSRFDDENWDGGANWYGGAEAMVRRQLTRRTQLALVYRYWDNAGGLSGDDFTQHRAALVFTYRR
ncbi:MAG: hypothetical protein ACE5FL_09255 [Myxococcota bacterium]